MIKSLYPFAQKWSETGSVYMISDPHFDDADCKIMNENWPNARDYINKIKNKVHKNDTLICLGDCGNVDYFKELDCYKVLIKGNHDKGNSVYQRVVRRYEYDFQTKEDAIKAKNSGVVTYIIQDGDTWIGYHATNFLMRCMTGRFSYQKSCLSHMNQS